MQGLGRSQESRKALLDSASRAMRAVGTRTSFDGMPPSEAPGEERAEAAPQPERPPLPSSNWTRDDPVPVALNTFKAAVEWLEAAPPLHRSAPALSDSLVIEHALCQRSGRGP